MPIRGVADARGAAHTEAVLAPERLVVVAALVAVGLLVAPLLRTAYSALRLWIWWRNAKLRLEGVAPDRSVAFPLSELRWAELALKHGLVSRVEPYARQVYVRPGHVPSAAGGALHARR
jgi:hypothetical protein